MREPSDQNSEGGSSSNGQVPQWLRGATRDGAKRRATQPRADRRGPGNRASGATSSSAAGQQVSRKPSARGGTGRFSLPVSTPSKKRGVVGARLQEVSGRRQGRGLPRGGIPGQAGLTVDKSALDSEDRRNRNAGAGKALKIIVVIVGILLVLVVAFLIAITLLSKTSAFKIDTVEADDSAHVSADSIVRLAKVDDGATLLNVDTKAIEENLEKNPWILSAKITREFPDTLKIEVTERQPSYLVVMGTGNLGWYLGSDNVWIEPTRIDVSGNQAVTDAALNVAQQAGAIVIADVPSTVSPVAGSACTDSEILTVESFQEQFSDDFKSQIVSYSAPDTNGVSCVLSDGIEVSLGSAANIDSKEAVIKQVLQDYEGQITYLNVRVPSSPSYRGIQGDDLSSGSGANGTSTEDGSSYSSTVADAAGKVQSNGSTNKSSSGGDGSSSSGSAGSSSSSAANAGTTSGSASSSNASSSSSSSVRSQSNSSSSDSSTSGN